ncbi:MAG: NYN domain-containing protein [bacterium]
MLYLIDAFNVIFSDRTLQKLALSDPSSAHRDFLKMVVDFCEVADARAILVYDGGNCIGAKCFYRDDHVKAYYAGGEADPLIIAMAPKLFKHNPELTVVSTDRVIRGHCGQMGIKTIGSITFFRKYLSR